jgi:hypothetical protein
MEFTSLAGVMGKHYAQQEGRSEAVAEAIFEAALPRSSDDVLPKTPAGTHPDTWTLHTVAIFCFCFRWLSLVETVEQGGGVFAY